MNKTTIISTMKLLKENRQEMLKEFDGEVLDVKYIGDINEDETKPKLAIYVINERYKRENKIFEVERYYAQDLQNGDIKFLAGNNINDGIDTIYLSNTYTLNDDIKNYLQTEINKIEKEAIYSLLDQEKLEEMAKKLGISVEEIESMVEIELEKEEKEKQEEAQNNLEDTKKQEKNEKEDNQLSEKQTKELTESAGKQEVNIDTQYDGKNSLRKELGLGDEYKSIMVVYSEKLRQIDGQENNTPLSFVAVDKNGKAKVIDSLELDTEAGSRPMKESIKIDNDETARQDINTLSRFKIAGTKNTLSVERGQYGEMKVYHGQKTKEENKPVEFQLETKNIKPTSREMKDLQRQDKGDYYTDRIENEVSGHLKNEEEVEGIDNMDGDPSTATHIHKDTENKQAIIEAWANEFWNENEYINAIYSKKNIEASINNALNLNGTVEKDKIEENIEKDARMYLGYMKKR